MFVAVFQSSLKINHHPQIKVGDCFEVEALTQILGCNVSDLLSGLDLNLEKIGITYLRRWKGD
jgi:hypothetical protein